MQPERASSRTIRARASRRGGFTLIEILIATAILTLGLVGILALFPVAIRAGRQVVEDSNAVVIAQSVAEAIRSGARNNKGYTKRGDPFFVFAHDGVTDPIPPDPNDYKEEADYYILLPVYPADASFSGSNDRNARRAALRRAKVFVYPESDPRANGGGNPVTADDDGDDERYQVDSDGDGSADTSIQDIRVEAVYHLGNHLVPGFAPKRDRETGRIEWDERALSQDSTLPDMMIDNLSQYSYAFKIRPSYFDADLSESGAFEPASKLFHVTVMVFRQFVAPVDGERSPHLDSNMKVYELDFEVSL